MDNFYPDIMATTYVNLKFCYIIITLTYGFETLYGIKFPIVHKTRFGLSVFGIYKFTKVIIIYLTKTPKKGGYSMFEEKILEIVRIDGKIRAPRTLSYYISISEAGENEFACRMYNVGIKDGESECVVENFSPKKSEAEKFLDILYENSVSTTYLNLIAEEYVSRV